MALWRQLISHQSDRDAIVAIDACDLFQQIGSDGDVQAVLWHGGVNRVAVDVAREVEPSQNSHDLGGAQGDAHHAFHVCRGNRNGYLLLFDRVFISQAGRDLSAGQFAHQFYCPARRFHRAAGRYPPPEANGCLAREAQGLAGATVIDEVESRCFQQDVVGFFSDFALQPAHDATHSDGTASVRDKQHLRS